MRMNKAFWMNKKVLITGHNGFKGTWLIKWLDMLGAYTMGIALEAEPESGIHKIHLSNRCTQVINDVRNKNTFDMVKEFEPQIVIHLAAQAIVGKAKDNPLETFETNLMGTVNLLETLRQVDSVKSILIVTSDKVYHNIETTKGYEEESPLMGSEPYSCSKVCQEQAAKAYYESYFKDLGVGVATARASNAFGGGDYHFDRLIPYLQKCIWEKESPAIRNPRSVRPWQYVFDLLNGYMMLAEKLYEEGMTYSGAYNFGPEKCELYTVAQIADMICGKYEATDKQDYYEAGLLFISSENSNKRLGWKPLFNVCEGIGETTKAYQSYFTKGNSNELYEERINSFEQKSRRNGD